MFVFNSLLNAKHLQEIYGEDLTIIQIMFESFLEANIPIWEQILEQINVGNYKQVGEMTHQIKPSFSMVGLNFLHPKIQDFELFAKTNPTKNDLLVKYNQLSLEINHAKLIIIDEVERLNEFNSSL